MGPAGGSPHLLMVSPLLPLVILLWLFVLFLMGSFSGVCSWLFLQEAQWWGFWWGPWVRDRVSPACVP